MFLSPLPPPLERPASYYEYRVNQEPSYTLTETSVFQWEEGHPDVISVNAQTSSPNAPFIVSSLPGVLSAAEPTLEGNVGRRPGLFTYTPPNIRSRLKLESVELILPPMILSIGSEAAATIKAMFGWALVVEGPTGIFLAEIVYSRELEITLKEIIAKDFSGEAELAQKNIFYEFKDPVTYAPGTAPTVYAVPFIEIISTEPKNVKEFQMSSRIPANVPGNIKKVTSVIRFTREFRR